MDWLFLITLWIILILTIILSLVILWFVMIVDAVQRAKWTWVFILALTLVIGFYWVSAVIYYFVEYKKRRRKR